MSFVIIPIHRMESTPQQPAASATPKTAQKSSELSRDQLLNYIKQQKLIIKKLEGQVSTLRAQGDTDSNVDQTQQITVLQEKLDASSGQISALENEILCLQEENNTKTVALMAAEEKVTSFEKEEEDGRLDKICNDMREHISHLTNKYNAEQQTHETDMRALRKQLEQTEHELSACTTKYEVHVREKKLMISSHGHSRRGTSCWRARGRALSALSATIKPRLTALLHRGHRLKTN